MPVKRGDTAVWIGLDPMHTKPTIVTVGTISPSGKTMLISTGKIDIIVDKKEVITERQARNRRMHPESPVEPDTAQETHLAVQDDVHPY